ncbi:hypothetical protein HOE67_04405 [Candidatus Peregrinibacteria bacterium]|jgi:hypothetical protein|nr:hypothetical protein [Candidatus Peregrinibacteria bacterium]MBT4056324.1 hypothetical protein [Candidatus Peregrinibacteria bacterium]
MGVLDFLGFGKKNTKASTSGASAQGTPSQPPRKPQTDSTNATQVHLKIGEIRDNFLVLKDGGLRAIFKASSINFNLKSENEQNAITYSYQGFLNSLEFPVQILVRSKKLDIDNYIDQIRTIGEKQENSLLKDQTMEYADFVKKLVEYTDIMQKEFYVIVPYNPVRSRGVPLIQKFLQRLRPKDTYGDIKRRHKEFENLKKAIAQRINVVQSGLSNCGINTEQLSTEEIIELYYNTYNPQISRTEKLKDLSSLNINTDEQAIAAEKAA